MEYKVHSYLKSLSANLKRFDMGNYFFKKDFQLILEENNLDEFWEYADKIRRQKEKVLILSIDSDFSEYTETFIVGLDLICQRFYNQDDNIEKTKINFSVFFDICFSYYLNNVNQSYDFSKLIELLEQNSFMIKDNLNHIKELIISNAYRHERNSKTSLAYQKVENIASENQKKSLKIVGHKKYQIFISSTYIDLKEERQAAVEAILKKGHIPAGMELFTAGDKSQWDVIKKWIDDSDIYLLILGGRYGSINKETSLSYTEMEYDYAIKQGKPFFALALSDKILDKKSVEIIKDFDVKNPMYIAFKEKIKTKMCSFPDNIDQIKIEINHSLDALISEHKSQLKGWIKGN